jgi:hypothetical protein
MPGMLTALVVQITGCHILYLNVLFTPCLNNLHVGSVQTIRQVVTSATSDRQLQRIRPRHKLVAHTRVHVRGHFLFLISD